jgi:hypothetical protein
VESRVSQIHSSAVIRLRASLAGLRADNAVAKKKAVKISRKRNVA